MAHHAAHEPAVSPAGSRDPSSLEAGRRLFARESRFVTAASDAASLPLATLPELAFAGRSNVGKSSLLNALAGRKSLARVSRTPGRTQQINFFDLGGRLMLVDLPGYGFAQAPQAQIAAWTRLIDGYLRGRKTLRRVLLLVDSRLGLKDSDREAMAMLDAVAVPYQLVLTKSDEVKPAALEETRDRVAGEAARHSAAHPDIMAASAHTGQGIAELRAALTGFARSASEDQP